LNYTVGEFEKKPLKNRFFLTDDYVILVGGSGLYVNAILKALMISEINNTIREAVKCNMKTRIVYLQEQLKTLIWHILKD
jgi:tRNA dimethylallyltransferase